MRLRIIVLGLSVSGPSPTPQRPDDDERSRRNHFAALPLDRMGESREHFDPAGNDAERRWLLLRRDGQMLVRRRSQDTQLYWQEQPCDGELPWSLLGRHDGYDYLLQFIDEDSQLSEPLAADAQWADLRAHAERLAPLDAGLAAYARGLVLWRDRHRHCGRCGAPMLIRAAGHRLVCTQSSCGNEVFPRIDPAIIVAISHGDRLLLARQASWPAGRHSVLAGFVEPGETLEDCVRREVAEEAGLTVERVRYHSSQPWPFPSALMIGFTAEAVDDRLALGDELEQADWYDPGTLVAAVRGGALGLPTGFSVSRRLIEDWYQARTGSVLTEAIARP